MSDVLLGVPVGRGGVAHGRFTGRGTVGERSANRVSGRGSTTPVINDSGTVGVSDTRV